jgi:2-amino-4-hydroxy-6-hydroxymethyldihydropteridine diphosphokinase
MALLYRPAMGIFVGLGSNLPSEAGSPAASLLAAVEVLSLHDVRVAAASRIYRSRPVPASDQPDFFNMVIRVETELEPADLLERLHAVEATFGRERGAPNAARSLDLDLLAYDDRIEPGPPVLPHPRLDGRAFVLLPLAELAPDWKHPETGQPLAGMIAALPDPGAAVPQ